MTWLEKTPIAVVRVHAEMMDRLYAEECMRGATVVGVGSGGSGQKGRERVKAQWARWERSARAGGGNGRPAKATPGALRTMGIGVRSVKRNG